MPSGGPHFTLMFTTAVSRPWSSTSSWPMSVNSATRPPVGFTIPMIALIVVVLPIPLRPSSVTTCPAPTESDTSKSAWLGP